MGSSKVTTKSNQLAQWINRIFPPSSPRVTQPGEINEQMILQMPALPPSLLFERTAIEVVDTVNPATLARFPANLLGVPKGKFLWVHAADWFKFSGEVIADGWSAIQVRANGAIPAITVGSGRIMLGTFQAYATTHSIAAAPTSIGILGGGVGGFIVPQGFEIAASTTANPGTAVFRLAVMYTACDIGELIPGIS